MRRVRTGVPFDVLVIGSGASGLAAAVSAQRSRAPDRTAGRESGRPVSSAAAQRAH